MFRSFDHHQGVFSSLLKSLYIQEMIRQHIFFNYVNIYVRLHVSTIQVVIISSLIEITGLQKAAHTFCDHK